MLSFLKKIFVWLGDNLIGHAVIDTIKGSFTAEGKKIVEDAVNKLTRKDLIMGVLFARYATAISRPSPQEIASGLKKFNRFYASLSREERDLFEQLFYRDVLDAIQEFLKNEAGRTELQRDPQVVYLRDLTQDELHQIYLALVGNSGPKEIRLEMERLHQMSASAKIKKVLTNAGTGADKLLGAFLNGLEGK